MKDVFEKIGEDDLSPDLKLVSDVLGIAAVRTLMRELAGMSIYVPKITRLDSFIDKYLLWNKERKLKELALELGVSEQYLKNKSKANQLGKRLP